MSEAAPHDGLVVWFTGLPASGKSTLAEATAAALRARAPDVAVLDGDEVRAALRPEPGYDEDARDRFYETLARFAALLSRQGLVVLVPATAHRRAYRQRARALCRRYLEVFVDTPLGQCEARDPKGLYARARSDQARPLPGVGVAFEAPTSPDLRVTPNDHDAVERLTQLIEARRLAP